MVSALVVQPASASRRTAVSTRLDARSSEQVRSGAGARGPCDHAFSAARAAHVPVRVDGLSWQT